MLNRDATTLHLICSHTCTTHHPKRQDSFTYTSYLPKTGQNHHSHPPHVTLLSLLHLPQYGNYVATAKTKIKL